MLELIDFGTTLTLLCVGMGIFHYSCQWCLVLVPDCDFIMVSFTVSKVCVLEFILHFYINEGFLNFLFVLISHPQGHFLPDSYQHTKLYYEKGIPYTGKESV